MVVIIDISIGISDFVSVYAMNIIYLYTSIYPRKRIWIALLSRRTTVRMRDMFYKIAREIILSCLPSQTLMDIARTPNQ